MIFVKKIVGRAQVLFSPQANLLGTVSSGALLAKARGALGSACVPTLAMLLWVVGCACVFVASTPAVSLAQTVQHELKGTVLPPANTGKEQTKNIPANNATNQAESNLSTEPESAKGRSGGSSGASSAPASAKEIPIEMTEVAIEASEEPFGTAGNQAAGNATPALNTNATGVINANGADGVSGETNATGTTGATNATGAAVSGGSSDSGSLKSMGDDDYFKVVPKEEEAFSWSGYFVAVGGLLLVLAVLWMLVWLLRKRGAFPGASLMNRNAFKVEATLPLGPKRCLMLVRFLDSRYLLGVTDQQITLIKELEEQDAQGNQSSKNVTGSGSTVSSAGERADIKASGSPAHSAGALDFAQALHEESQKSDGKLQL